MLDGCHIENRFWPYPGSRVRFPMKFCVGKKFFSEFQQRDRYPCSTERICRCKNLAVEKNTTSKTAKTEKVITSRCYA